MPLTTTGLNLVASIVGGVSQPLSGANAYIGVGDSQTAFDVSQNDLVGSSKLRKGMSSGFPSTVPPAITFKAVFEQGEANFNWEEWGIFNAASGGTMLVRRQETNGAKQNNQVWTLEVTLTFEIR